MSEPEPQSNSPTPPIKPSLGIIGGRVRTLRKQAGMTQAELAAQVGISTTYINLIEKNKRNVGGKLLNDITVALGISRDQLTQGVTTDLIERLQQTARKFAQDSGEQAELDQIEFFTTRFPGWARLLDQQIITHENLERVSEQLSDRLSNDPVLAETIHIMLSNISAIRSTSELLALYGNVPENKRAKFVQNIFVESKRLSTTAEKLLLHLDPQRELPSTMPDQGHKKASFQEPQNTPLSEISSDKDYIHAEKTINTDILIETQKKHGFNPFHIADLFNIPIRGVFLYLTRHSSENGVPTFGLLEIDNAGGVLMREEIDAFRLPSRSGACPRWPVYRALGQPNSPISMHMQLNSGQSYASYALAQPRNRQYVQLAPVMSAIMIYRPISPSSAFEGSPQKVDVGFHCSICSRTECSDRREGYILKVNTAS